MNITSPNSRMGRATNGAGGPYHVGPGTVCSAKLERKFARADRKRGEHRDGYGSAERHGEGGGDPLPEEESTLGSRFFLLAKKPCRADYQPTGLLYPASECGV